MTEFRIVGIIGLGVIGASLGMALKHCSGGLRVLGRDVSSDIVMRAGEMGAVDGELRDVDISECDLLVICTPLGAIEETLLSIRDHLKAGAVVTDVGSVKGRIMQAYESQLPPSAYFIGGHPMAGSEKNGLSAADKFLLENAAYILTPPSNLPQEVLEDVKALLTEAGARVIVMSAEDHDRAVARVSHLPHVIAGAMMHLFSENSDTLALAGGSLRDMTRIAGSNPVFWRYIFEMNRTALLQEIDGFASQVGDIRKMVADGSWENVVQYLETSSQIKGLMRPQRRCLEDSVDIVAIVPDQPGMIGKIGHLLGEEQINIKDIHVLSVRDEDEGSIKLSVPSKDGMRACQVLTAAGMTSWIRD